MGKLREKTNQQTRVMGERLGACQPQSGKQPTSSLLLIPSLWECMEKINQYLADPFGTLG